MKKKSYKVANIVSIAVEGDQITLGLTADVWDKKTMDGLRYVVLDANEESLGFQKGDLVKFEDENPKELTKIPVIEMNYDEYCEIKRKAGGMTCEQLIETYESLIGKVDEYGAKHSAFIFDILDRDGGFCIPKEFGQNFVDFLHSKEVSDYFKNWIWDKIKNNPLDGKNPKLIGVVINALQSGRNIADFTEEEFNSIYRALQGNCNSLENTIIALALKLDSKGARGFLNNCAYSQALIKQIVRTSGLSDRPEYYSGRGAIICDLSGKHLKSIYNKLKKLDEKKALSMLQMVIDMKTLGATEFIESLYRLASSGYVYKKQNISQDNNSFGEARGEEMLGVALGIFASKLGGYKRDDTEAIRSEFLYLLPEEEAQAYRRVRGTNYERRAH